MKNDFNRGYIKALKEILKIAEDTDNTYIVEYIKSKLGYEN